LVSSRSIRRYRWRGPVRSASQYWHTFLRNHAHHLWAADLLTVPTLTFKTLYVLVFIAHGRRELVQGNGRPNPTAALGVAAAHRGHRRARSRAICSAITTPSTAASFASTLGVSA
jgi:hypothetical protein